MEFEAENFEAWNNLSFLGMDEVGGLMKVPCPGRIHSMKTIPVEQKVTNETDVYSRSYMRSNSAKREALPLYILPLPILDPYTYPGQVIEGGGGGQD